ncbi:MAG TPA: hypothetical protein DCL54_04525, partial [Alphaproteobacteria bacterium]|nr:hypothetical protein [Alphaproteobacteria bacterium]
PAAPKDIHAATKPPAEAGATAAQTPERAVQDAATALPDAGPHQQSTDHPPQDRQHDTPKPQEFLTQAKDANGGQTVAPALQNAAQPKADANPPQFAALTPPPPPGPAAASAPPPPLVLYTPAPAVPLTPDMIALTIARKAQDGLQTFEIRLDPPELGALEVNLSFDELGRTQAQIRAERPEALELLQREAKGLEQALRQAGITLEQGALNFQLTGRQTADDRGGHGQGRRAKLAAALPADQIQSMAIDAGQRHIGALDLRV